MIKIGIPSSFFYPDKSRVVYGHKSLCYIEKDMATFLARPGILPVLIPDLYGQEMKFFLNEMDGFVFQGGTDMAPQSYGEEPILDGKWKGDPYRDEYELAIMEYAMKSGKPIFGICRGIQVMNVYFGGTLYQDITTQKPGSLVHRDADLYDQLNHAISFEKEKLFDKLYKDELEKKVNSVHHQGVKDLGKNLTVQATCTEDGLIEAFTWDGAEEGKVMGIQWHPEFTYNFKGGKLINPDLLYNHFLSFCGKEHEVKI